MQDQMMINNLFSSFNNNGGTVNFANPCSECSSIKRPSSSSSPSSYSPQTLKINLPSKIQPNPSPSKSTPPSSPVSPTPTLPLRAVSSDTPPSLKLWRTPSPSPSASPPPTIKIDSLPIPTKSWEEIVASAFSKPPTSPDCVLSLSCGQSVGRSERKDSPLKSVSNSSVLPSSPSFFSSPSPPPRKVDSLSTPTKRSWQEMASSAFSTPPSSPDWVLSLCCGKNGGGGVESQKQDSPLRSISNSPVSSLSPSYVTPSLGSPSSSSSSVSSPLPWWRPSPSPSPSPSPPLLFPSPIAPPPTKPNSFSTPIKSRRGLTLSSAPSSPAPVEAAPPKSPNYALCGQCSGGSKTAKSNGGGGCGGGSTPPSAAAKEKWRKVRDGLTEMQHKWMMENISKQLEEQNNEAPVTAVNKRPNIDINNKLHLQEVNEAVPSYQNVQVGLEVVQDENVSFDRDGDTMRICYKCCCGRQKQIFFGITN